MAAYTGLKLFSRRQPEDGVVFIGGPDSVSADVWLENAEARQLQLRHASVVSTLVRAAEQVQTDRIARIPVPKFIRPLERQLLTVSFDLDPSTPPGTYDASVILEGPEDTATFPAQIVVTQNYALTIEPDQLVFQAPAGGSFDGEVIVINEGNVPIDVVALGEFPLKDPWRAPRCCCCREDADGERTAESDVDTDDDERSFGAIVIDNDTTTVEPASLAVIRFVARLPAELPGNRHLRARPRIGIERFSLDVITRAGAAIHTEPSAAARGRRSQQQKRKRA